MIKYNLKCENSHVFEAWFKNSNAYDAQSERGIVSCTFCGSHSVTKAPMAPSIPSKGNRKSKQDEVASAQQEQMTVAIKALKDIRKTVEENCDYVGNQFAEEARKIHYGETDDRGIYGEATEDEKAELADEGVDVASIPWVPTENS
jgi:hypothetical protein